MINVIVVDDSAYMRHVLRSNLDADPEIRVVDTARDGQDALEKIAALKPDVVTLDLEMPRMDGFTALQRIMATSPLPVIILSSLSQEGADATIRALRLGAVDFVPKPAGGAVDLQLILGELLQKIKQVAGMNATKLRSAQRVPPRESTRPAGTPPVCRDSRGAIVIGSSTGGPRALYELVPHLPASLPSGVLIVQHMPPGFTRSLAQRLDELSPLKVKEAAEGDVVQAGLALIAPGSYHMTIARGGAISLNQGPPQHGVRPAADVTMISAARVYGSSTIGVVLTGMGCDGSLGVRAIHQVGGRCIAEDESTCIIFGMPRCAIETGGVDRVVPIDKIAGEIVAMTEGKRSTRTTASS